MLGRPVFVDQRSDFLVAFDFGRLRVGDHRHVGHAVQFAGQHCVGAQRFVKLNQCDVADQTGQVNGRLNTRVAAANHRHMLAFEQGAVAMWAIGHAFVFKLALAGHVDVFPARTG